MNLDWHIRLIDRLIKKDPEATIKDYFKIVERGEKIDNTNNDFGVMLVSPRKLLKKKLELEEFTFSQNGHSKHV